MNTRTIITNSPDETISLGERLAKSLNGGDLVALNGDLGAGKTMFVKGVAKGLGMKDYKYVNSPSFVILKEYSQGKKLYHFDVYRLEQKSFLETLDYERYFYGDGITIVEWADRIKDLLPEEHLGVKIFHEGETKRRFEFRALGERFKEVVDKL